jgi:hypothetical protein
MAGYLSGSDSSEIDQTAAETLRRLGDATELAPALKPVKPTDYDDRIDYGDIDSVAEDEDIDLPTAPNEGPSDLNEESAALANYVFYEEGAFKMVKAGGEEVLCYSELFAPLPATRACYEKQHLIQHLCKTGSLSEFHKFVRSQQEFKNELRRLFSSLRENDSKRTATLTEDSFLRSEAEYERRWLKKRLAELEVALRDEETLPGEVPYKRLKTNDLHLWPIADFDIGSAVVWEGQVTRTTVQSRPVKVLKFDDGGNILQLHKATLASHSRPIVVNRKETESKKTAEDSAPRESLNLFLSSLISARQFESAPMVESWPMASEPISFALEPCRGRVGKVEQVGQNPLLREEFGSHWGEPPDCKLRVEAENKPKLFEEPTDTLCMDIPSRMNPRFSNHAWEHLVFLDRKHSLHRQLSKIVYNLADPAMHFIWPDRPCKPVTHAESEDGASDQQALNPQEQKQRRIEAVLKGVPLSELEDMRGALSVLSEDTSRAGTKAGLYSERNYKTNITTLKHAKPAYDAVFLKTNWTEYELFHLHRPSLAFTFRRENCPTKWAVRLVAEETQTGAESPQSEAENLTSAELYKLEKHLSLKSGKFVLFEFIEKQPPLLNNFAMASKLKRYFRNLRPEDAEPYVGTLGIPINLEHKEKLPLIGQLQDQQALPVLETNLFRAPVYSQSPRHNDFILVRCQTSKGKPKFYLRSLEFLYSTGQIEPKVEVFTPKSRNTNLFQQNRIQAYIYNFLINNDNRIAMFDIAQAFPNLNESVIRKTLKTMNCEQMKDQSWFCMMLPNEQEIRELITPEKICQYESMLAGQLSLHNRGISITSIDKLPAAVQKLKKEVIEPRTAYLAGYIEDELMVTPWNLTSSYIMTKQNKGMMRIEGVGDPTHGLCGYSFVRLPMKLPQNDKPVQNETSKNTPFNKIVTGTDADLRKLSMAEVKRKLVQLGCPEDRIEGLPRWDRVALLRNLSSQAVAEGKEGSITKYARGTRVTTKMQKEEYQLAVNKIFQSQIKLLGIERDYAEHYSSDSDDEHVANELTDFMMKPTKPSETRVINFADDEDRFELQQLEALRKEKLQVLQGDRPSEVMVTNSGKKQVIRRITRMRRLDGSVTERVEYLSSAVDVQEYIDRQDKQKQSFAKADRLKRAANTIEQKLHLGLENKRRKPDGIEETRRLQEEKMRLEEQQEYSQLCLNKIEAGQANSEGASKIVCGKCGMAGHMRTNRKRCPMYTSDMLEPSQAEKDGILKAEGFKLSFSIEGINKLPSKKKDERRGFTDDYLKPRTAIRKRRYIEDNPFEEIAFNLMRFDKTRMFIASVKKEQVPDYYDVVKNPIDLDVIRAKAKRGEYSSAAAFIDDLELMVRNAQIYNGPVNEISQQAQLICEEGLRLLKERELLVEVPQEEEMDLE